jgi:GNAT superfamily N-acetyltransferase
MQVSIREMRPEDAGTIAMLSNQLGYQLSPQETEDQIAAVLSDKDHCAFVALAEDGILGWIHGFKAIRIETKPFIEIGGLVVDENLRGKGIGRKLVDRIQEWCVEKDINKLRVRCQTKRAGAHIFYSRLGFRETKEQKVFEIEC